MDPAAPDAATPAIRVPDEAPRPRRRWAEILAPAGAYAACLFLVNLSFELLAEGSPHWRLVRYGALATMAVVFVASITIPALRPGNEWVKGALAQAPMSLVLGAWTANVVLVYGWGVPAGMLQAQIVTWALPLALLAPVAMMLSGLIRLVLEARSGRATPSTPP